MTSFNIGAKIKRNKLDELAGAFFQGTNSTIVNFLKSEGNDALVGIQKNEGVYTIIGEKHTYYLSQDGIKKKIANEELLRILRTNALDKGKRGDFEYIKLSEGDIVWVCNEDVMAALWNILLWISKVG